MKISIVGSPNNFNGTSSKTKNDEFILDMEKKIDSITKSLSRPYFNKILKDLLRNYPSNAITIYDYIIEEQTGVNIKDSIK